MTRRMMTVRIAVPDYEEFVIKARKLGFTPEVLAEEVFKEVMKDPAKYLGIHH